MKEMMKGAATMTQMIAERINEIRKNKNVSVQTIVDNGISKSKYFAFIRVEREIGRAHV